MITAGHNTNTPLRTCLRIALVRAALVAALTASLTDAAIAYVPGQRWTTTASGSAGTDGDPVTLTWSLIRDGTSIPSENASNLISFLDSTYGAGSGGTDYTQRPWFHLLQDSFNRWAQLSGVTFEYESHDDGVQLESTAGALGVRGDIRLGGANVDGPSGTLAYTLLPNDGDIVIDTSEASFFGDSTNNYRAFRDTVMHEIGHAFGLLHVESSTEHLLMEPIIDTTFDGPQLDDIRAIQGYYGDAFEKTNGGLGNGTAAHATSLGAIASGGSKLVGAAATGGQAVGPTETDFVSIANSADADYFSFTVAQASTLSVTLTPLGGVFNQAPEGGTQTSFDANSRNDLALAVFGNNGASQLAAANNTGLGGIESLVNLRLAAAGQYFVRVTGANDNMQSYELALSALNAVTLASGDYNGDGRVDGADFAVWQRTLGKTGAGLAADGNGDGTVNAADLAVWRSDFGAVAASGAASLHAVPEPQAAAILTWLAAPLALAARGRRNCQRHRG